MKGKAALPSFRSSPIRGCDAAGWVRPGNGKSPWVRGSVSARVPAKHSRRDTPAGIPRRLVACAISRSRGGVYPSARSSWRDRAASSRARSGEARNQRYVARCPPAGWPTTRAIERASPLPERVANVGARIPNGLVAGGGSLRTELTSTALGQNDVARGFAGLLHKTMVPGSHTKARSHQPCSAPNPHCR